MTSQTLLLPARVRAAITGAMRRLARFFAQIGYRLAMPEILSQVVGNRVRVRGVFVGSVGNLR
jgi:hypothetical protein